jgi:hypoxanthine phosphoribosyltransferase
MTSDLRSGETPGMWTRKGPYIMEWGDLGRLLERLAGEIGRSGFEPTVICAVARGGLIAASYLSVILDLPMDIVRVRRTEDDTLYAAKRRPVFEAGARSAELGRDSRVLVVDDIVGTGATARLVLDELGRRGAGEMRTAALVRNHLSAFVPEFHGFVADDWVIFPWERTEDSPRPADWRPFPSGTHA